MPGIASWHPIPRDRHRGRACTAWPALRLLMKAASSNMHHSLLGWKQSQLLSLQSSVQRESECFIGHCETNRYGLKTHLCRPSSEIKILALAIAGTISAGNNRAATARKLSCLCSNNLESSRQGSQCFLHSKHVNEKGRDVHQNII